ncbi:hypothetical protein SAFG77S_00054 [Streptomyces afghaniensis]
MCAHACGAVTHGEALARYPVSPGHCGRERRKGNYVFRAIADVLRQIGGAIATVVTLPFRALARLFGGASSSTRSRRV